MDEITLGYDETLPGIVDDDAIVLYSQAADTVVVHEADVNLQTETGGCVDGD